MAKNNISLFCNVVENHGVEFLETDEGGELTGELLIKTDKGKTFKLFLRDLWAKATDYTWVGCRLLLHYVKPEPENDRLVLDIDGYLVLEPDILVSPSSIRVTEGCIRKYYVQKRQGVSGKNYPMLRGVLVNNSFDLLIENDSLTDRKRTKKEILEKVLKDMLIELSSLEEHNLPEPDKVKGDLTQHLNALAVWKTHKKFLESEEMSTEPTFISRKYGLSGRLDLLVNPGKEAITYELKTGKAPDSTPWRNDIYQVACYQLLLESAFECVNPDSYLIYSQGKGNELLKQCSINFKTRRQVINNRNQIVAIDHALIHDLHKSPEYKKLIPPTESGNCEKCLVKNECFSICHRLGEKSCSGCGVVQICNKPDSLPYNSPEGAPVSGYRNNQDIAYYEKYFQLIEFERNENRKKFSRIFEDIKAILDEGKAIINLEFAGLEERTLKLSTSSLIESEIKPGDLVLLFNEKITRGEVFKATVKHIERYDVEIALKKTIPREFFENKSWNIYTDTMETTYDTMNGALYALLSNENAQKRDLILGRKKPAFRAVDEGLELNPSLNSRQKFAIRKALSAEDYFLIQGPPGTGKTHTLANLIIELVKKGNKVLLSAFTHRSIDNVLLKILEEGFTEFLRIGSHEAVDPELHPYLIQEKFKDFTFDDIREIQKQLESFPVIACSSISSMSSSLIRRLNFDVAVVDEAGQLTEPGTISIILQAGKFILVGDHKQLPPVVQSNDAKSRGLDKSLFERLIEINRENVKDVLITLEEQYRMNENIMEYSNKNFYDFALKAHENVAKQQLNIAAGILDSEYYEVFAPEHPLVFINLESSGNLKSNSAEAALLLKLSMVLTKYGIPPEKIGIITPFRAQVAEIKRAFYALDTTEFQSLTIDTVDRFQGSDRDIIMFSSVATRPDQVTDFFTDFRRINVSVTRAKKKFILIGNKDILVRSELFYKLIRLSKEVNLKF
jgi:DNA replication ATP-dependent helicase Dna2